MSRDDVVQILSPLHFVPELVPGAFQHLHAVNGTTSSITIKYQAVSVVHR